MTRSCLTEFTVSRFTVSLPEVAEQHDISLLRHAGGCVNCSRLFVCLSVFCLFVFVCLLVLLFVPEIVQSSSLLIYK